MNISNELFFCKDLYTELDAFLKKHYSTSKKVLLIDERVYDYWGSKILVDIAAFNKAEVIIIPSGEDNKVIEICTHVWESLLNYEISRNDVIINIGGGVTTDLGGFIASTYKRGIDFINVPTTLMAQVDASHGGKTGIDLAGFKNVVGTFSFPKAIFVNSSFLETLPPNEITSGFAEMLKHGLIDDKELWNNLLLSSGQLKELIPYIQPCVQIKNKIVSKDFKESGERKKLNFGHSIGHGIESYYLSIKKTITHGEAVAWGMIFESMISLEKKLIDESSFKLVLNGIEKFYQLPKKEHLPLDLILPFVKNDKKNTESKIQMVLLEKIGKAVIDIEVSESEIEKAFESVYLTCS